MVVSARRYLRILPSAIVLWNRDRARPEAEQRAEIAGGDLTMGTPTFSNLKYVGSYLRFQYSTVQYSTSCYNAVLVLYRSTRLVLV